MENNCSKCGEQILLMSGTIYLEPDAEPYESGKEENPKTDISEINRYIIAHFCENCDEIVKTFNE